jgi:hypothetical protein
MYIHRYRIHRNWRGKYNKIFHNIFDLDSALFSKCGRKVSNEIDSRDESRNTLVYADRAKNISNKVSARSQVSLPEEVNRRVTRLGKFSTFLCPFFEISLKGPNFGFFFAKNIV